jgi:hypothetical protein
MDGGAGSSGSVDIDAISKGKNILKSFMLEGVGVNINKTFRICNTTSYKLLLGLASRVNYC